jgi:hypothetical protein
MTPWLVPGGALTCSTARVGWPASIAHAVP